ncbi:MAG: aminotransferase class III-fold pyridoxal phosphate-dependent enzyme [Pseudomonadota bacterium]
MATPASTFWQQQLAAHWPIDDALTQLDGEWDLNFATSDTIFKVMRAGCDSALIDMQIAALGLLHANPLIPNMVMTSGGETVISADDESGAPRKVWALQRLPGQPLQRCRPWHTELLTHAGGELARLHTALKTLDHPALERSFEWHPLSAPDVLRSARELQAHPHGSLITSLMNAIALPAVDKARLLPRQALHNDLNEFNLLVDAAPHARTSLSGIIDFGDMCHGPVIADVANLCAYMMLGQTRPFDALAAIVRGYTRQQPLGEEALTLLWPLIVSRLCVSAVIAHNAQQAGRDDPYLQVSQQPLLALLRDYGHTDPIQVRCNVLTAADLHCADTTIQAWLDGHQQRIAPVFATSLADAPILDLSVTGVDSTDDPIAPDMADIQRAVERLQRGDPNQPVLGRYGEPRLVYGAPFYWAGKHLASDRRSVHIAIDVFLPAGTLVHAPLDAIVHSADVCDAAYDYGGLVVLRHETDAGDPFFSLYGHLTHASAAALTEGQEIAAGEAFASLGTPDENGGWPPHIHLQLGITDRPGPDWPGVVDPDEWPFMQRVFPDPARLLGLPPGHATAEWPHALDVAATREIHAPGNLRTSYDAPIAIARGWQSLLFDLQGRTYLDAYNNVPHVGHAHPHVRAAIDHQMRLVNTNSRYLQPIHSRYIERLTGRMPDGLDVCYLLSSGSEANELALRLARARTGREDVIALKAGYHGHTIATIAISDYKFSGPGGAGQADWVHIADNPDVFRGKHRGDDASERYAEDMTSLAQQLTARGRTPAAFIAETFPSVGGQIVPPAGYLPGVYAAVRAAGGVCVADEVQTGLGRLGRFFWGFEQQQATPDIVVLGKPMGNGYPLAAVVTTQAIAKSFDTGMEFFATFGGASVACAAGLAVLDVVEHERLPENAELVGGHLLQGLTSLAERYPLLADVRGQGLFIGVEIADPERQPLPDATHYIVNRLREQRILIGSDGPEHNVLKIRPPLCFSVADADYLLTGLDHVLAEPGLRHYEA